MNVSDTNYKSQPLFVYDILVKCPRSFRLISRLPTGDHPTMGRDFTVSVRDANKTIHLMLHRPRGTKEHDAHNSRAALSDQEDRDKGVFHLLLWNFGVKSQASNCNILPPSYIALFFVKVNFLPHIWPYAFYQKKKTCM